MGRKRGRGRGGMCLLCLHSAWVLAACLNDFWALPEHSQALATSLVGRLSLCPSLLLSPTSLSLCLPLSPSLPLSLSLTIHTEVRTHSTSPELSLVTPSYCCERVLFFSLPLFISSKCLVPLQAPADPCSCRWVAVGRHRVAQKKGVRKT